MLTLLTTPPRPLAAHDATDATPDAAHDAAEERAWLDAAFGSDALGAQYQRVRELGRGGMGIVFLARDLQLHRVVAIKLLRRELAASDEDRARFRREARLMARLTHGAIVPIHAYGEHALPGGDRVAYFVMRYVDGESLAERLRREGRLPPREVTRVLGELALALDYAHGEGVVHRDLKPENVLVERGGAGHAARVLLSDFGVAALPSYDPLPGEAGLSIGTPHYMSPEQLVGEHAIDGRSDLYALGVLGYTLLAGRPPFQGRSLEELSARHLLQRAPSLARLAPGTPAALVAAIERCLAKDPARRWARGKDLHAALQRRLPGWPRWADALRAAVI
jgi:eukaryotic-like serine/threonine-protein kinase